MTQAEQRSDENHATAPAEIERLTQELHRARDMYVRTRADFNNYRKRVQREWDSAAQAGKRQLVLALLDAVDVIKTDQATADVVLDELSHGYRWGDEVLRPARGRVAQ